VVGGMRQALDVYLEYVFNISTTATRCIEIGVTRKTVSEAAKAWRGRCAEHYAVAEERGCEAEG